MSRQSRDANPNITFHAGGDHAIGRFLDITDKRYAGSKKDEQGEGYVFEYSEMFGISTNLIGATINDLHDYEKLIALTEAFVSKECQLIYIQSCKCNTKELLNKKLEYIKAELIDKSIIFSYNAYSTDSSFDNEVIDILYCPFCGTKL